MSADSASIECEQGANEPLKVVRERKGEGEKCKTEKCKKWTEEGDEHRVRR